jgi:Fe-S cluster assembly ATP-binding protein
VDAVKIVSQGVEKFKTSENSLLIITHNTKILEYLPVDAVHILMDGKIVRTGDRSLIDRINDSGFQGLEAPAV